MTSREQKVYDTLKEIWYDVSEVREVTEDVFHAQIPRIRIDMNNLIELQGKLVWNHPEISLGFVEVGKIDITLNFPSYE